MNSDRKVSTIIHLFASAVILTALLVVYPLQKAAGEPARSPALEKVIEGAKKEGVLKTQWYAGEMDGETGMRQIVAAMNKRYGTNIKLRFTPGPTFAKMINKIMQENAAGRPSSTDVNLMTSNHANRGEKRGVFRKLDWESILERPAPRGAIVNRIAPGGYAVMIAAGIVGITYNTNLVKRDDIPASMEDVFKPKWKGKIGSTPYATGLHHFAADDMLGYEYMKNYTKRLAAHIGGLFSCTSVDRLSSGEFAMLVFDCGSYNTLRYKKRGAPVSTTTVKEALRVNHFYMGVPVHAKHPNAATLFINFLHTREGQRLIWDVTRFDLHIYPESRSRKEVLEVANRGGKVMLDTVERDLKIGHEKVNRIKDEFIKILKQGGR